MPYSDLTKFNVSKAPKTLGNQLGRWAVHLDLPVIQIAKATGATRQTVYNWFHGREVMNAYKNSVTIIVNILKTSATAEEAWGKICKAFDLQA